jgi:hypothetical protein
MKKGGCSRITTGRGWLAHRISFSR